MKVLLQVAARDDVCEKIIPRIDQETLGNCVCIVSNFARFSRREHAKIPWRNYGQKFLGRFRTSHGESAAWRLPKRKCRFIGDEKTVRRSCDRSPRRRVRHEIPLRDDLALLILLPRRIKRRPHHSGIYLRTAVRRNLRGFDEHAQVVFPEGPRFGQTNIKEAKRTVTVIFKLVDNVKMDAVRRSAGNLNLGLPVAKMIARAKGMDAARGKNGACTQSNKKQNARSRYGSQDEEILRR